MSKRPMSESKSRVDTSLLDLSPSERDKRDITPEDIKDVLLNVIRHGSQQDKILTGCTFPSLDFSYHDLDGENNHPIVFRDCTFEDEIDITHADIKLPVQFEKCIINGFSLERARFECAVGFRRTTFSTEVSALKARFDREVDFTETTFEAPVTVDEAKFDDGVQFTKAQFQDEASFRDATFSGSSNELEDHASFAGTIFEGEVNFRQTAFRFTTFKQAVFQQRAHFAEASFEGDANFSSVSFGGEADFDETVVKKDVSFENADFQTDARFRGAAFEGGARSLQDDARFVSATFHGNANFRDAELRYVNFDSAVFEERAIFEETWYGADADFTDVLFEGKTDFDEARFTEGADFSESRFKRQAVFRGAEFKGGVQHFEKNATFESAQFDNDVDFDNSTFTSANFTNTRFNGIIDFTGAVFSDEIAFLAESVDTDTYVDFTDTSLKEGKIIQPEDGRVRYDLTDASLGDVIFDTVDDSNDRHDLLDYVRFCNTQFNEFDGYEFNFSRYTEYLDRNNWELHRFDENAAEYEYAREMTPEAIEITYLKAKIAASAAGYIKAAGEFRVNRQRYARQKHLVIARDESVDIRSRIRNVSRAVENYFLGITCGYGMRFNRIAVVFLLTPVIPSFLYAFGGSAFQTSTDQIASLGHLATLEGLMTFYKFVYFSYMTFLTIGYGGVSPQGILAQLLAGMEIYLSVILGGLVLYALVKRSEV
jgi:uncharacterized protein YjbI with pentapeptide repeats